MESGRGIVEIFGKCSRLLNKTALNIEDDFFSRLCAKKSDKLLSEFIFFLKREGRDGRPGAVAAHQRSYVAQYYQRLISKIEDILNLLDILKHLDLAEPSASLLLEKNLLLLKLSVLNAVSQTAAFCGKAEKPVPLKPKKPPRKKPSSSILTPAHLEISEFVRSKERVQNSEVFSQFPQISRRTMKRKLSELIKSGAIRRFTDGKKVFYAAL
ncbi:MAG: hypothetical protein AAB792_02625 [Patescibacteria group bacterium]